eukprot:GFUD01083168.1.p1 GENE.GFUD01083168.1~~GFUD01083168.1.p1  ORF type:complete len:2042 (+),score=445.04 GFUD01083168.1:252-6377(+)
MAESGANRQQDRRRGSQSQNTVPYDNNALLSLYGMSAGIYGMGGGAGAGYGYPPGMPAMMTTAQPTAPTSLPTTTSSSSLGTLGVAASQAASLGLNPASAAWWNMASQIAAQDYLTRIQQAARDPAQYAALQAQGILPGYDMLTQGSKARKPNESKNIQARATSTPTSMFESLKLPSDTEIVRTVASSVSTNSAIRKKSVENSGYTGNSNSHSSPIPNIPAGLTIEKKKPGRKPMDPNYHVPSSGQMIDRVEITKIPMTNGTSVPLDMSKHNDNKPLDEDAPLNLSMKSDSDNASVCDQPLSLTIKDKENDGEKDLLSSYSSSASKIPSDYYASQALSGVFLAEQIRQQQLASELQNHLQSSSSLTAMQALLNMGKLNSNGNLSAENLRKQKEGNRGASKNLGRGNVTTKPKKNTVASMLAQTRGVPSNDKLSDNSLANSHPELTIEPIYRSTTAESNVAADSDFDQSQGGRRISTYIDSEGRLQIKNVSESPEIRNSSERDSEDGQGSDSEAEFHEDGTTKGKRYYATEHDDLQAPMNNGWRRETTIREYTKSGIRGEVVYVAPCGKRFKQYPDIIRYLEKRGINNIKRENFSFSTKLIIGDFLRPTGQNDNNTGEEKYIRYTEDQMNDEIDKVRKENGWKPRKRNKPSNSRDGSRKTNGAEKTDQQRLEEQYRLLQRLQVEAIEREKKRRDEQEQIKLQKEAMRILKEAEKRDKLDQAKRERESKHQQFMEDKRRKQEEQNKLKQEEKMKKLQEIELKRQQNAIYKEQERERRRQHMVLIKQLDVKKKNDERKRNMEKMRIEKEKEKERRTETRKLEVEIINEMRKPVEDMALPDSKHLPDLPRIEKLKLCGEAFANILMVFEFLHNFGETLGFDMESLPTMTSFQSALLNEDIESEEEMLSIMSHLVVCAIEDPGVPMPLKQLTILGQNLRQADITNTNLSEILRIFIQGRAMAEIKLFHGLTPPEPKDKKEAILSPFVNADEAYMQLLSENKTYQISQWIKDKPFLCLNATHKSEIITFLCNELLNNKAVVNQIEVTMENTHVMKRKKLALELKVKKLRLLHNRKYRFKAEMGRFLEDNTNASGSNLADSECHSEAGDDKDDAMSVMSDSTRLSESNCDTPTKGKGKKKSKKGQKGKRKLDDELEDENGEDENQSDIDLSDIDDEKEEDEEDAQLSAEDLQKKIERLTKVAKKKSEDHTFVNNTLRATDLGQDRYRRRYWHLAHAGGIFVEGLESAEPWKLATRGLRDSDDEKLASQEAWNTNDTEKMNSPPAKKLKLEDPVKLEGENKENIIGQALAVSTPTADKSRSETEEALRKLGSDIMVTPKSEIKSESKFAPRVTPNGDRLNMFNHSAYFNMSLSPVILNGAVTITPKEGNNSYYGLSIPGLGDKAQEKPWFNLMARADSPPPGQDSITDIDFHPGKTKMPDTDATPQITLLDKKLEIVKEMNKECSRLPVPVDKCHGWWKVTDEQMVSLVETSLLQKGTREQNLLTNIRKGIDAILESSKKVAPEEIDIMDEEYQELDMEGINPKDIEKPEEVVPGVSVADQPESWSKEVALRVDKYILEQVEALEDKVASASMQGWKMPDRPLVDTLSFRPSCEEPLEDDTRLDPVEVARQRLLELELAIERRYLKAPLGQSNHDVTLQTITDSKEKQAEKDDSMETDDIEEAIETENIEMDSIQELDTTASGVVVENGVDNHEDSNDDNTQHSDSKEDEKEDENKERKRPTEEISRGLQTWRDAVKGAKNAAQLAMAFYVLETSIAWDKSIMKASCQFCHGGDNENALLLCDGCDKGYHTYCFKPPITIIPEGDWYCYECINKATGLRHCLVCGGQEGSNLVHCSTCPRAYHTNCINPAMAKTPRGKWDCPGCNLKGPKKKFKKPSQIFNSSEMDDTLASSSQPPSTETSLLEESLPETLKNNKKKNSRSSKIDKDLSICHTLLSELGGHEDCWPFLTPVNTKQFPTYKKIIRIPMDISTIRKKLNDGMYKLRDEFREDVNHIFGNCEIFNEDDSPVGKSGHNMKVFFGSRWAELTNN